MSSKETNIDSLTINIKTNAKDAEKGIDSLISKLGALKAAIDIDTKKQASSLGNLAESLRKVASAAKSLESVKMGYQMRKLNTFIQSINDMTIDTKKFETISFVSKSIQSMNKSMMKLTTVGDIQPAIERLQDNLNNIGNLSFDSPKINDISSSISSLTRSFGKLAKTEFGNASNNLDIVKSSILSLSSALQEAKANTSVLREIKDSTGEQIGTKEDTFGNIKDFSHSLTFLRKSITKFDIDPTKLQKVVDTIEQLAKASSGIGQTSMQIQALATSVSLLNKRVNELTAGSRGGRHFKSLLSEFGSLGKMFSTVAIGRGIGKSIRLASDMIEQMNVLEVAYGDNTEATLEWSKSMTSALGLNQAEFNKFLAGFKNLNNTLGVSEEQADLMSKNMTQLTYDMASLYNISDEDAFNKLQSAITGSIRPLRQLGVDISEAAIAQTALQYGITTSVSKLTQADKAILKYITIMKRTKNAQQDLSRTLTSPGNAARLAKESFTSLSIAIGKIFIPIMQKALPVIKLLTDSLTYLADVVATFLGFEMPDFDGKNVKSVANDISDVGDEAAAAAKKVKDFTLGFDELHTLNDKSSDNEENASSILSSIDLSQYSYDMLGELGDQYSETMDKIKNAIDRFAQSPGAQMIGDILKSIWDGIKKLGDWALEHPETIADLATDLTLLVGALAAFNTIVSIITFFQNLNNKIRLISGAIKGMSFTGALMGIIKLAGAFIMVIAALNVLKDLWIVFAEWSENTVLENASNITKTIQDAFLLVLGIGMFTGNVLLVALGGIAFAVLDNWNICTKYMAILLQGLADVIVAIGETIYDTVSAVIIGIYDGMVVLIKFIADRVISLMEGFETFSNWLKELFESPTLTIAKLFKNMGISVLKVLKWIAEKMDAVFGTKLADGIQNTIDNIEKEYLKFEKEQKEKDPEKYAGQEERKNKLDDKWENIKKKANETFEDMIIPFDKLFDYEATKNTHKAFQINVDYWSEDVEKNRSRSFSDILRGLDSKGNKIDDDSIGSVKSLFENFAKSLGFDLVKPKETTDDEKEQTDNIKDTKKSVGDIGADIKKSAEDMANSLGLDSQALDLAKQSTESTDDIKTSTEENKNISEENKNIANEQKAISNSGWNRLHEQMSNIWYKLDRVQRACENIRINIYNEYNYGCSERANGGFVGSGDLFIANEAGPEMIGSIGNKTAVANQSQMVEAIAGGVYDAMISAMNKQNNRPIEVTSNLVVENRTLATAVSQGTIANGYNMGLGGLNV